jgi:hypothetical protein
MRKLAVLATVAALIGVPLAFGQAGAPPPITIDVSTPLPVETTDPSGADVTYTVKSHVDLPVTCSPAGGPGTTFTQTWHFPVGTSTIACSDGTNSASADVTVTLLVPDTTPPTLTVPGPLTAEATSTAGASVSYTVTATDDSGAVPTISCDHPSGSTFPLGTTTVTCTATDSANNSSNGSFTVTVQDTTPPILNLPSNITVEPTSGSGAVVTFSASASDAASGALPANCTPSSGSTFPIGTTTVNCTATDGVGLQANGSFTVAVTDSAGPTFSNVPANVTVEANGPAGSAVNYTAPTANDAVDGPAVVTCSPPSGSTFPIGGTTVTCSATDAHGNPGTTTFSVSVVDTTNPSLIVPADRAVYAETPDGISAQSAAVAQFLSEAQAADTVDPNPHVSNNAPAFFTVGTHVVTFTASDASGNTISRAATLDVRPLPPAGTTPPPLPTPPAPTRPKDVTGLKAEAGDARVRLSWQIPAGVDHVVVTHQLSVGGDTQVVYTGSAESFTDRGLVNGLEYRYVVVSVDKAGNSSAGVAVVALPKATLLRSPKDGARLKKPPKLVWVKNSEASYYNVQIFRGAVKILSTWPAKATVKLKRTWKYQGHTYKLTPGVYRWYVWPGFGARSAVDYGELLGFSSFQIIR